MKSFTSNSLFVRCGIAAMAYYIPQDLGIGAILALNVRSNSNKITGNKSPGPNKDQLDEILNNFMLRHGFPEGSYDVSYNNRHTVVNLF